MVQPLLTQLNSKFPCHREKKGSTIFKQPDTHMNTRFKVFQAKGSNQTSKKTFIPSSIKIFNSNKQQCYMSCLCVCKCMYDPCLYVCSMLCDAAAGGPKQISISFWGLSQKQAWGPPRHLFYPLFSPLINNKS